MLFLILFLLLQRHLKTHEGSQGLSDSEQAEAMVQFNAMQQEAKNNAAATLQHVQGIQGIPGGGMPLGGMGAMSAMMNLAGSPMPPHLNSMEQ